MLKEIYSNAKDRKIISFEVFPPKEDFDGSKLEKLISHLQLLKKYSPLFVSLTYGANGSGQSASFEILKRIKTEVGVEVMPHFTCVGTSRKQVIQYLSEIEKLGINFILALRGDIPQGLEYSRFDFNYANELVEFIKTRTKLSIGVAGYPEGHLTCVDLNTDMKNLKKKVDAGADAIFTQMFFDTDKFFDFTERAQKAGINCPIIPGILPVISYKNFQNMLSMARVSVPQDFLHQLEKHKESPDEIKKIGVEFTTTQCSKLLSQGVQGLHFFTLNTSSSIIKILDNLSI